MFHTRGKDTTFELTEEEHLEGLNHIRTMSCPNVHMLRPAIDWIHKNDAIRVLAPCEAEWRCAHLGKIMQLMM